MSGQGGNIPGAELFLLAGETEAVGRSTRDSANNGILWQKIMI
jgi:hypothetical protein